MPTFERGTVVRVPFPHTNNRILEHRPAAVISNGQIGAGGFLLWILMITSAEHRHWPGDIVIADLQAAGLRAPSMIRTVKVANIEADTAERLGVLSQETMHLVDRELAGILGLQLRDADA
jgi:mRNA interferase MazF